MSGPSIRYCTTEDGVRIAYAVDGGGPPIVVLPPLLESFSLDHLYPAWADFVERLSKDRTVIRLDWRGSGRSERRVADMSYSALARDLNAAIDATGLERVTVYAQGGSVSAAALYIHDHQERVAAFIAYGASLRPPLRAERLATLCALARSDWHWAAQAIASTRAGTLGDAAQEHTKLLESSTSGENMALAMEQWSADGDAKPILSTLLVPTLVLHRLNDVDIPFRHAEELASSIPGSRLIPMPGRINFAALEEPDAVLDAIDQFLDEHVSTNHDAQVTDTAATSGRFRTVLFTDIVGHTEMMQRLGDAKGRDVLREHERITRETLKAHGGAEVKTMGDGFMASFGSVTSAMECAIALQRAFASHTESMPEPLHVRVGLNAGEPIEEDGDLFGATVILASRIAAKAGAGEILVPDTVRGLLSGKQFLFSDRGEFVPKGFDDAVRLYEVRWRE